MVCSQLLQVLPGGFGAGIGAHRRFEFLNGFGDAPCLLVVQPQVEMRGELVRLQLQRSSIEAFHILIVSLHLQGRGKVRVERCCEGGAFLL